MGELTSLILKSVVVPLKEREFGKEYIFLTQLLINAAVTFH